MRNQTATLHGFMGQIITADYTKLKQWAFNEPMPNQIVLSSFFSILECDYKIKTLNTKHTSYGYKHYVERISNRLVELVPHYQYEYIGNEDFIIGALKFGFDIKNSGEHRVYLSPNYYFNISEKIHYETTFNDILNKVAGVIQGVICHE